MAASAAVVIMLVNDLYLTGKFGKGTYKVLLRSKQKWDPLCYVNAWLPSRRGFRVSLCCQSSYATFENES